MNNTNSKCSKIGIKIHESNNNPKVFTPNTNDNITNNKQILYNNSLCNIDLNIENYSLNDLYQLFNINEQQLTPSILKNAKLITLKIHPDKSKLDSKYFLFFSKAYKRLFSIYEFQNKSTNKTYKDEDLYDESNVHILDNMFKNNKELKDTNNFNNWFNGLFEKHRLEDPNKTGYGDWLKTDEGIYNIESNVTQANMNEAFEKQKKQIQSLSVYQGVTDSNSAYNGSSLLGEEIDNFSGSGFTDLRQAHIETVMPIGNEDYKNIQKFNNVNEYKANRDRTDITPLSKLESNRILNQNKDYLEKESTALAFKYAKESEVAKAKQQSFWGDVKQITGW